MSSHRRAGSDRFARVRVDRARFPGNPYPSHEACRVQREGEPMAACEVHGRLSPDGTLLATWYRPDFSLWSTRWVCPPEVVADHAGWLARLHTLRAEVTVHELDTGIERYRTKLSARSRIVDFDGRFVVVAPCRGVRPGCDLPGHEIRGRSSTRRRAATSDRAGQVALLRPQGDSGSITEVDAPTLRRGDTGAWVSFLQQALVARGLTIDVDGIFGPVTESAVARPPARCRHRSSTASSGRDMDDVDLRDSTIAAFGDRDPSHVRDRTDRLRHAGRRGGPHGAECHPRVARTSMRSRTARTGLPRSASRAQAGSIAYEPTGCSAKAASSGGSTVVCRLRSPMPKGHQER